MFGAAKSNSACAEGNCVGRLLRVICVRAHLQPRGFGAPLHELREVLIGAAVLGFQRFLQQDLNNLGGGGLYFSGIDLTGGAVD